MVISNQSSGNISTSNSSFNKELVKQRIYDMEISFMAISLSTQRTIPSLELTAFRITTRYSPLAVTLRNCSINFVKVASMLKRERGNTTGKIISK